MPMYCWRPKGDATMDNVIEVLRNFADYDIPPTVDEGAEDGVEYERVIPAGIKVTRAEGFGKKGHWISLLTGGSLLWILQQSLDMLL